MTAASPGTTGRGRRRRLFPLVGVAAFAVAIAVVGTAARLEPDHRVRQPQAVEVAATTAASPTAPASPTTPSPTTGAGGKLVMSKVRAAIKKYLSGGTMGGHVLAAVAPLTGKPVFTWGSGAATPASTTKLLTASAALHVFGPDHRFRTSVLDGGTAGGVPVVVVKGGGDPLLMSKHDPARPYYADITTLAKRTAAALVASGTARVRVRYDTTLFFGRHQADTWPSSYRALVAPLTSLWIDEGHSANGGRLPDPARSAAEKFAAVLGRHGVKIVGTPASTRAKPAAATIAEVDSATLSQELDYTLLYSDNEAAEVLAHDVGAATSHGGTFAGGVTGTLQSLRDLGISTRGVVLHDGSGLSRDDLIPVSTLVSVLQLAADPASETAAIPPALPLAGKSGSLDDRFTRKSDPGRGVVRAKTGTLTGVDALAGYTEDAQGTPLVFVVMADRVASETRAVTTIDAVASALTACKCG